LAINNGHWTGIDKPGDEINPFQVEVLYCDVKVVVTVIHNLYRDKPSLVNKCRNNNVDKILPKL